MYTMLARQNEGTSLGSATCLKARPGGSIYNSGGGEQTPDEFTAGQHNQIIELRIQ